MAQMTDEEKRRALDIFKQQAIGTAGIQGPNGTVYPNSGETIGPKTKRSFTDNIRNTVRQNTPNGAYGFNQTVGPLINAVNPLPSLKRTFTGENIRQYANPNNGLDWKQRLLLGGEDALNLWAVGGLAKSGVKAIVTASTGTETGAARALAARRAALANKFTPTANMDNYIFHGGPTNLEGGVVNPDFVRGGKLYKEKVDPLMLRGPSVLDGPNAAEDRWFLESFDNAKSALAGEVNPNRSNFGTIDPKTFYGGEEAAINANNRTISSARDFIDRYENIVNRIKSGENHATGVDRFSIKDVYSTPVLDGRLSNVDTSIHVLNVPNDQLGRATISPSGEMQFWGKQKPVASVPSFNENGAIPGAKQNAIQAMIDNADINSIKSQKLANALARARGTQITPAYKKRISELIDRNLNNEIYQYVDNPSYTEGMSPRMQYVEDYSSPMVPAISNLEEVQKMIASSKTKDDVIRALNSIKGNKSLDISLAKKLNSSSLKDILDSVLSEVNNLNTGYTRLREIRRR